MRAFRSTLNWYRLKIILNELRRRDLLPEFEFSKIGPNMMCTAYIHRKESPAGINVDATCGMSRFSDEAFIKATVEYVERLAAKTFIEQCETWNRTSDGFASFPSILSLKCKKIARTNALHEAIERYSWMAWWSSVEIKYRKTILSDKAISDLRLNEFFRSSLSAERIFLIEPTISGVEGTLIILVCKLKGHGYVSGGAFGVDRKVTFDRALGELMRHYLAVTQFQDQLGQIHLMDCYNRRLRFFAIGQGHDSVEKRLESNGKLAIHLPELKIDTEIAHPLSSFVYTHRCLFAGQKEFVDQDEKIFCL
jgi:hypothetical protein